MNKDLFVKLTIEPLKSGGFANLDAPSFKTFIMLTTFIDDEGYCYPTQKTLADMAGVNERTVRRHIDNLLAYRTPSGNPILTVEKRKSPNSEFYYNYYKVEGLAGYGTADNLGVKNDKVVNEDVSNLSYKQEPYSKQEPINKNHIINNSDNQPKEYTSKEVIVYFKDKYFKKYGVGYPMTNKDWGKFGKFITTKVINEYPDGDLVFASIDTLFEIYDDQFKKPDFPAPTLWNLGNFTFQKAVAITQDRLKTSKADEERIAAEQAKAEERLGKIEDDEDIADLFTKMKNRNKR